MMPQQFQQPEPSSRFHFMKDIGIPLIAAILSSIVTLISTIIIGTTHVIEFSWLLLILVSIMLGITVFCIWYTVRAGRRLQEKYQEDVTTLKREYRAFQDNYRDMVNQEFNRLNEWANSYAQANAKE